MSADLEQLHAPFRSRRGRVVGWVSAIAQALVLLVAATALSGEAGWLDRLGFLVVAAGIGWGLVRLAEVAADADESGLVVRNVLLTRRVGWSEIAGIRFGNGDPWVLLDLTEGDTLAVMAIQRADGAFGRAQARRLATLVALHRGERAG